MDSLNDSDTTDTVADLAARRPADLLENDVLPTPIVSCLIQELQTLADLQNYHRWVFDEICPFLGTKIAEIGGGIGTFSRQIVLEYLSSNRNARLEIFEPTACLFDQLERNFRQLHGECLASGALTITPGHFRTAPKQYDSILLINVLEHVQREDTLFHQIHESLQSNGVLIVFVPALQWLYSELDKKVGHYRRYEQESLYSLFERNGFTVVKTKYMDILGILPWYLMNVLGKSHSFNPFLTKLYDQWFVPATRLVEQLSGAAVGKNLLMVGRTRSSSPL